MKEGKRAPGDKLVLFIAHGFGSGLVPVAPGTFGTLAGYAWIYLLLLFECKWIYLAGIVLGFFAAVWIGGRAEKILDVKDPGSIVIDEIAAMPLAFAPAVFLNSLGASTPAFAHYFSHGGIEASTVVLSFLLFRLFDIVKPLGINRLQDLPGGWGLVADDFLAALYSAALLFLYLIVTGFGTVRAIR
jgi:phosphatidylglycerophosphatase A